MIHIVNHPYLADLESKVSWEDSGKFIALGEIFENLGLTDKDTMAQNKVVSSPLSSSSSPARRRPWT